MLDRNGRSSGCQRLELVLLTPSGPLATKKRTFGDLPIDCEIYAFHRSPWIGVRLPTITDRFRRDSPFVRWHRDISWRVREDGQEVVKSKIRRSAVHKTDIRERCVFCDTGGMTRAFNSADQMQQRASLPAPQEKGFRKELCAFCFPGHV